MDPARRARLAVQRVATETAPDDRVAVFDCAVTGDPPTLSGTVSTPALRQRALRAAREAAGEPIECDVTVLSALAEPVTCTTGVAAVRDAPGSDGERVTELRYGCEATAFDARDGWRRVRAPDGYLGWVAAAALTEPVGIDPTLLTTDELDVAGTAVPRGTPCERVGEGRVRFRTGAETETGAVEEPRTPEGESVVAVAEEYLGTEYRWGGTTREGIDCSGLVWMAYARHGITLPRDTDQQASMGDSVALDALEPGDLVFWPGHVAVSTGGRDFLHAYGSANRVQHNSLDPDAEDYLADLHESVEGARRLL